MADLQTIHFNDLSTTPVQATPCRTCPFAGEAPIQLAPERYADYVAAIVNLKSQHLCHSAGNKKICRGGRTLMLRALCMRKLILEPTDEAYETARAEIIGINHNKFILD
jgi:hypothetical protein